MRTAMLAAIVGAVVVAPAAAFAGPRAATPAEKSPCIPKVVTIKGDNGLALCGPATAVVHSGGRTYRYKNGFCGTFGKGIFQLSLGTSVPMANGNADKPYFSVNVGNNTPHASGFAYYGGKKPIPAGVFIVKGSPTSQASFTAGAASGSWNCHGVVATE